MSESKRPRREETAEEVVEEIIQTNEVVPPTAGLPSPPNDTALALAITPVTLKRDIDEYEATRHDRVHYSLKHATFEWCEVSHWLGPGDRIAVD